MKTDTLPCCEPEAALARLEGDEELYREVLVRLFADSSSMLDNIQAAVLDGNNEQLHYLAHSLKGYAATCGATAAAAAAAELEALGREGRVNEASAALGKLDSAMARTRDELAPYVR